MSQATPEPKWRASTGLASAHSRHGYARGRGLGLLALALLATIVASLVFGTRALSATTLLSDFLSTTAATPEQLIVLELRLPRTLAGLAVGASFAVAGVLMQAISRNPLADPGLLGVNAGASFAVVLAIWLLGISTMAEMVWFAFLGAGAVTALVYMLGSMGQGAATPLRLTLAGAALSALLFGLTKALLLSDQNTLEIFRFWSVGTLAGAHLDDLQLLLPFVAGGFALALMLATPLNAIALGDSTAKALGIALAPSRLLALVCITLLAGSSVAIAGPIGFVGLVVPHLARFYCGPDQRWLICYAALLGPIVLLCCDIIGRVLMPPAEVQVGIVTALVGGPAFVWAVRRFTGDRR